MPECPYCGKWFRSNKGLKQHIAKSHTSHGPLGRVLNPMTFDFLGAVERRIKRKQRRKKDQLF